MTRNSPTDVTVAFSALTGGASADAFATVHGAADLSECAREPIHIPGAIQPHGALLICTADGLRITQASANIEAFLGLAPRDVLGKPLEFVLGDAAAGLLADSSYSPMRHEFRLAGEGRADPLSLRAFPANERFGIDIERVLEEDRQKKPLASVHAAFHAFRDARSVAELCDMAVQSFRAITGYDRVMTYRFGPDGHGEVIAEARAEDLEAYLGQRYPASDIPEQARRLYLRQRVGAIVDAAYVPVPLLAHADDADEPPADLTFSALRSVSPVHREFMRNMQTAASLTIGLERSDQPQNRELWGMIVCHHRTPRIAGIEIRTIADLIGQVVALLIGSQITAAVYTQQTERRSTLTQIMARLAQPGSIIDALSTTRSELLRLTDAAAVVIQLNGETVCLGSTPAKSVIDAVFALVRADAPGQIVAIDSLAARDPTLAAHAPECNGVLAVPLGKHPDDTIMWIRPEQTQTVTWGGNPTKAARADAITGRLSPRASFDAWREIIRGRSLPWSAADLSLAAELRTGIEEEIAQRTKLVLDLFSRIFKSSPVALLLIDRTGQIKMSNRETEHAFGYEPGELVGKPLEQLVPARSRARHAGLRRDYLANPSVRKMTMLNEVFGLRKDGSEFPVEITLSPVTPQEVVGEPLVQASVTDLTARRASEGAKRAAQERLQSIETHVPAMVAYWNRDLRCEFANQLYLEWVGRPGADIVGQSMRDILSDEQFQQTADCVRGVLAGVDQHIEMTTQKPDGTRGYSDARYVADRDDRGAVRGFYVLVIDVSSLQEARLALEASNAQLAYTNRELDQFVYTASHDLRSPLRAINSLVQFVLEDDHALNEETQERLRLIGSRSRRMQRMLDQILEYARASKESAGGTAIEVGAIIDDVVAALDIPPDFAIVQDKSLRSVLVRPMPIFQVLQNLIGNAIKHHDRTHGTIGVSVEARGDRWRFMVTDDGPGIPVAHRESVFEMFTTLKRRDEVEASGMGLALVRKLVKLQGGACGIEAPGERGALIWFDWPTCESSKE